MSKGKTPQAQESALRTRRKPIVLRVVLMASLPPAQMRGQIWHRALVVGSDNRQILLRSPHEIRAEAGDELLIEGRFLPPQGRNLPRNFEVLPPALKPRLQACLLQNASVHSFGAMADREDRPILQVLRACSSQGLALDFLAPGLCRINRVGVSEDPVLQWLRGLLDGVSCEVPITLIDPRNFLVSYGKGRVTKEKRLRENKRIRRALKKALPLAKHHFITKDYAVGARRGRAVSSWRRIQDKPRTYIRQKIVMPDNPYRSASSVWAGYTGLPTFAFAPKKLPNMEHYRHFVAAHEAAHAMQYEFGQTTLTKCPAATQRHECFADAFAILATLQKMGDAETLATIANYRHQKILTSQTLSHYTGPAAEAALQLGLDLQVKGKLQHLTAQDMLQEAEKIVKQHGLSRSAYAQLRRKRHRLLWKYGLKRRKHGAIHTEALIAMLKRRKPDSAPYQLLGDEAWRFTRALQALEATSYSPQDLARAKNRQAALALYAEDMAESLSRCAHVAHQRGLIDAERRRFTTGQLNRKRRKKHGFRAEELDMVLRRAHLLRQMRRKIEARAHLNPAPKSGARSSSTTLTLRSRTGDCWISQHLSLSPKKRLKAYRKVLTQEYKALCALQGQAGSIIARETLQQAQKKRLQLAYALRLDAQEWQSLPAANRKRTARLYRHITAVAQHHRFQIGTRAGQLNQRRKRLERQIRHLGL